MRRRLRAVAALAGALLAFGPAAPAQSAAHAFSTDGEATAYVLADFSRDFDLVYDLSLSAAPRNRSWSLVGVMLLGEVVPSDSVEVGLFRSGAAVRAFTSVAKRSGAPAFVSRGTCADPCRVELRGDSATIVALIGGREAARWPRPSFRFGRPQVQLNAEVDKPGDRIAARLRPIRTRAGHSTLAPPDCAFTTRGIEVRTSGRGELAFFGTHDARARVTYFALADGSARSGCPAP